MTTPESPPPRSKSPRRGDTYRHVRRRSCYTIIGAATLQTEIPVGDETMIVIYQSDDGRLWARPMQEFCDGRFEQIGSQDERLL